MCKKISDRTFEEWISALQGGKSLSRSEYCVLIDSADSAQQELLRSVAESVTVSHFGHAVYVRGLIEISSYCRNNCLYCGLRRSNREAERYRLTQKEILDVCRQGYADGFRTFVLQGGEDTALSDAYVADVVRAIKKICPEAAVTLSLGERSPECYQMWREAGADRYLLRHETRNEQHYAHLHPQEMSAAARRQCLEHLKTLGYQVGAGMMVGSPGQTTQHLVDDLEYLDELRPEMIGIGPFIPAANTPFAHESAGDVRKVLILLSLLRLRHPYALIPSTTALISLYPEGRQLGLMAGANVLMSNLTPGSVRHKYAIYQNKACTGCEEGAYVHTLNQHLHAIGRHVDMGRGDFKEKNQTSCIK